MKFRTTIKSSEIPNWTHKMVKSGLRLFFISETAYHTGQDQSYRTVYLETGQVTTVRVGNTRKIFPFKMKV